MPPRDHCPLSPVRLSEPYALAPAIPPVRHEMSGSSSDACPVNLAHGGVPLTTPVRHTVAAAIQGSTTFLLKLSISIMWSTTPAASAPRHSTSALEVRSMREFRRDAEGLHVAETVNETHALP